LVLAAWSMDSWLFLSMNLIRVFSWAFTMLEMTSRVMLLNNRESIEREYREYIEYIERV